jgi:hypothetical protein
MNNRNRRERYGLRLSEDSLGLLNQFARHATGSLKLLTRYLVQIPVGEHVVLTEAVRGFPQPLERSLALHSLVIECLPC